MVFPWMNGFSVKELEGHISILGKDLVSRNIICLGRLVIGGGTFEAWYDKVKQAMT